jgi:hypothetical protein
VTPWLTRPELDGLWEARMSAVRALIANVGGPAERFRDCYDDSPDGKPQAS